MGIDVPGSKRRVRIPVDPDLLRRRQSRQPPGPASAAVNPHERPILDHQPHRPGWRCNGCGDDWPCRIYRQHIVLDAPATQLAIMMTTMMIEAADDLPGPVPGLLWDRFVRRTRA
jgi:hypothetical protein